MQGGRRHTPGRRRHTPGLDAHETCSDTKPVPLHIEDPRPRAPAHNWHGPSCTHRETLRRWRLQGENNTSKLKDAPGAKRVPLRVSTWSTSMHIAYMQTYTHTCIHTYKHTYKHTSFSFSKGGSGSPCGITSWLLRRTGRPSRLLTAMKPPCSMHPAARSTRPQRCSSVYASGDGAGGGARASG